MEFQELLLQIIVIGGFGIWAYAKVMGKSVREVLEEIKDFLQEFNDE